MEGIADWLARITWPLVTRVLSALGMGTVTYVGADTALSAALNQVKASFAGITGEVAQLLAMAGFFDAMAIMSGGIVSGLAWMVLKRMALQTTGGTS
jgi:hypothetical protein